MVNGHTVTQPLNLFLFAASGCKHDHMGERGRNEQGAVIRSKVIKREGKRKNSQKRGKQHNQIEKLHKA